MSSFAFIFGVLFCLHIFSYECDGKINLPPGGNRLTFLSGSTAKVQWSYDDISKVIYRVWYLKSSGGSPREPLAFIVFDGDPQILNSSIPGVDIEKPATLVLKNVDLSYNGTYLFQLVSPGGGKSEVAVFIAVKPTVTVNCSSPTIVNEGDNVRCVCRGEGGNPPAKVNWYKDGLQISGIGNEKQTLSLSNVKKTDRGTYKCVAQSAFRINGTDERSIDVIVRRISKPKNTAIIITPKRAVIGGPVTITCYSDGLPEPSYTIIHNGSGLLTTAKTYTISKVQWSDAGTYECISANKLGNDSKNYTLNL